MVCAFLCLFHTFVIHRALIEKEGQANALELDLLDNGSGADLVANDGLYSRYFAGFDTEGRYILR